MNDKETFIELIKTFNSAMEKSDSINRRLIKVMAIIVLIVSFSFSFVLGFFINNYFSTDYQYPDTKIENTNKNENINN